MTNRNESNSTQETQTDNQLVSEDVEVAGHIIDSLILPKILDEITSLGGSFEICDINIGHRRHDPSYARLQVSANTSDQLTTILKSINQHGAVAVSDDDCRTEVADKDGCFPACSIGETICF